MLFRPGFHRCGLICTIGELFILGTTILFSAVDEVAARYPEYIAGIREFLSQYGMTVGVDGAPVLLAERLVQEPLFGEDLLSMLRVVCAENQEVSCLQLLGLLLVAAQGQQMAAASSGNPAAESTARKLFNFLVDHRRSMRIDDEPLEPEALRAETLERRGLPETAVAYEEPPAREMLPLQAPPIATDREKPNAVLARALALSADGEMFSRPEPREEVEEARATLPWVAGFCGVVLGILLGLLLQRRPQGHIAIEATRMQEPVGPSDTAQEPNGPPRLPRTPRSLPAKKLRPDVYSDAASAPISGGRPPYTASGVSRPLQSHPVAPSRALPEPATGAGAAPYAPGSVGKAPNQLPRPASVREVRLTAPADTDYALSAHSLRSARVSVGSAGIMAANLLSSPAPLYPAQASAAQVQGEVIVEAIVGRDGEVVETRVVSGPPLLRAAAESAVQRWRYRPYEVDGSPAEIATTARLEFKLDAE